MVEFKNVDKLIFRRLILLMVFASILTVLIPNIFNFEKYYGLSRFIDQGYIGVFLNNRLEFFLTLFMSFFSLTSFILIYLFISIGRFFFLIYIILNFLIIILGGDKINYGILYPLDWIKSITEASLIYLMFIGNFKKNFQ
tara:strand:+ start:72 stop:491 length:420 start_codon:yes stop_codon:yes gene_type:complete